MQWLTIRSFNGEVRVLLNKAFCTLFEGFDCLFSPPICIVSVLVIVAASGIEGVRELVTRDCAECAVAKILWRVDVKDGKLHYSGWENNLIPGRVVIWTHNQQTREFDGKFIRS